MSATAAPAPDAPVTKRFISSRGPKGRTSLIAYGLPMIWSNGGALVLAVVMIVGLLALVFLHGMSTFWPVPVVQVRTVGGTVYMGEVIRDEEYRPPPSAIEALPAGERAAAQAKVDARKGVSERRLIHIGNFE